MATTIRYAHLRANPDQLHVYYQPGPAEPAVIDLHRRPGLTTLFQAASQALYERGWVLGVDGWRRPLDPTGPLVATAHLESLSGPRYG